MESARGVDTPLQDGVRRRLQASGQHREGVRHVESPHGHYLRVTFRAATYKVEGAAVIQSDAFSKDKLQGYGAVAASLEGDNNLIHIIFCFDDLRDAHNAAFMLLGSDFQCEAQYVTQIEYASAVKDRGLAAKTQLNEGQVDFVATYSGDKKEHNNLRLHDALHLFASRYGDIMTFVRLDTHPDRLQSQMMFRVEYYSINAARHATTLLEETLPYSYDQQWTVVAKELPDLRTFNQASSPPLCSGQCGGSNSNGSRSSSTGRTAWKVNDGQFEMCQPPHPVPKAVVPSGGSGTSLSVGSFHHPSAPDQYVDNSFTPAQEDDSWVGPSAYQMAFLNMTNNGYDDSIIQGPQVIDVERIKAGHDFRTSIMLRNLPNNIDAQFLKDKILDPCVHGLYDFSYLRFDFQKSLNVGYAFVNFIDPQHIVTFYEHWNGGPWCPGLTYHLKTNPRLAEMAYATTQGVESKINKFRNSSVMCEYPPFRPKLWYTAATTPDKSLWGTEMEFPPPDNQAKLNRSRDNATQIGLFAPARNNGQGFRGGRGRRQRSQYDRGTLQQIGEEAALNQQDFMAAYPMQQPFVPMMGGPMMPPQQYLPNMQGQYNNINYQQPCVPGMQLPPAGQYQNFNGQVQFPNGVPGAEHGTPLGPSINGAVQNANSGRGGHRRKNGDNNGGNNANSNDANYDVQGGSGSTHGYGHFNGFNGQY